MALLEVQGLVKVFSRDGKDVTAIDNLSLSVEAREFVTIVGPSGCGKSTFLHIIGGFERATTGVIRLQGRAITAPAPDRGMMFQEPALFPWRTALGNVTWGLEAQGVPAAERQRTAERLLRMVGLTRFAHS